VTEKELKYRRFFLAFPISEKSSRKFILSWSHYLKLIRIENLQERSCYEIECAANNWSLKELQRQCESALFERLALSGYPPVLSRRFLPKQSR